MTTPTVAVTDPTQRVIDSSIPTIQQQHHHHQQELEDVRVKLRIMMDAVSLVSKLASVDSIDYQNYCINPSDNAETSSCVHDQITPRFGNHNKILVRTKMVSHDRLSSSQAAQGFKNDKRDDSDVCHCILNIQYLLDSLAQNGELQDTSIPTLIKSIHRLQSNVTHLQAESENNALIIHTLQDALNKSNDRVHHLEAAIQGLYEEKTELKAQLKLKKKESRYFAKSVREYITMKRKESLEKDAIVATTRLSVHESMLKSLRRADIHDMDKDYLSMANSFDDFNPLRKIDSMDMTTFDPCLEDALLMSQSLVITRSSNGDSPESLRQFLTRPLSPSEPRSRATSTDSFASTISRVTDSGVPTVRFDFQKDIINADPEMKVGSTHTFEYVLKDESSSHVGLVFKLMELSSSRQPLLDGKLLDSVADDQNTSCTEQTLKNSTLKGSGLSFKIDDLFSRTPKKKDTVMVSNEPEFAVLVCGFDDFDDQSNIRPLLGARLIAIGDESLMDKKNLSLPMIHDMIMKASVYGFTLCRTVKLTFRHDPLTRDQRNKFQDNVHPLTNKLQDNVPRADIVSVKDEPSSLSMNDKPKFFDKFFPSIVRDQHQFKEKVPQTAFNEKTVSFSIDTPRRESGIFKIKL